MSVLACDMHVSLTTPAWLTRFAYIYAGRLLELTVGVDRSPTPSAIRVFLQTRALGTLAEGIELGLLSG
jgi:hypothetical protein